MRPRKRWLCVVMLSLAGCIACGSDSNGDGDGAGGDGNNGDTSRMCTSSDPGINWAPCKKDSDCYTGFCKLDGNPGPYCFPPTNANVAAGRGYTCEDDSDCEEVAPDFVARGGNAWCTHDSIKDSCSFSCGE